MKRVQMNITASIHQRLLNLARTSNRPFNELLEYFAIEPAWKVAADKSDREEKSMGRIVVGVITGFFAWLKMWTGSEKILSALWPEGFGVHQRAFEAAVKNGALFTAVSTMLLTQIVMGAIVSVLSGMLAALIAGENTRAPLFLGFALLALGLLKAVMSWRQVPIWYHVIFTAILLPMAIFGDRLITTTS